MAISFGNNKGINTNTGGATAPPAEGYTNQGYGGYSDLLNKSMGNLMNPDMTPGYGQKDRITLIPTDPTTGTGGGFKVDPSLPKAVREVIERNEKAGTPENIEGEISKIPDGAAGDGILDKMKGALGGAIGGLMGPLGGMVGAGAGSVAGKLGEGWIRLIIISVGIIVLIAGLFLLGQGATVKVTSEVASSGAGKAVRKLVPAGKAASIVKGVVS